MRNKNKMPQHRKEIIKDINNLIASPQNKVKLSDIINLHKKLKKGASV